MSLDDRIAARARKNQRVMLNALSNIGQTRVADLVGESDTTVSRFKSTDLERCASILAACGLKVVSEDKKYLGEEFLRALHTMAKRGLEAEPSTDFDDSI